LKLEKTSIKLIVDGDVKENIIASQANSKANSQAKEISSNAETKDLIHSPTEKKTKFIC
jgi:hypothetical protein